MRIATLERWTWVLIFGGLLVLSTSAFIDAGMRLLRTAIGVAGAIAAAVGVGLIFVRSRLHDDTR